MMKPTNARGATALVVLEPDAVHGLEAAGEERVVTAEAPVAFALNAEYGDNLVKGVIEIP